MLKLKLLLQNIVKAHCYTTEYPQCIHYPRYQLAKVCPFQDLNKGRNHNAMKLLGGSTVVKKHHCYTYARNVSAMSGPGRLKGLNIAQTRSDSFRHLSTIQYPHIDILEENAECKNDKHIVPLGFGCEGPKGSCWIPPQPCGGTAVICLNNHVDLRLSQSKIIILLCGYVICIHKSYTCMIMHY